MLNEAERTYYKYNKSVTVTDLLVWFQAELALEPKGFEKHLNYTEGHLLKYTDHVEQLAGEWRKNRI